MTKTEKTVIRQAQKLASTYEDYDYSLMHGLANDEIREAKVYRELAKLRILIKEQNNEQKSNRQTS